MHTNSSSSTYFTQNTNSIPCVIHNLHLNQPLHIVESLSCPQEYFQFIWIVKGSGNQWIDLQKIEITNGQIICLRPDQVHRFDCNEDVDGYVIKLERNFITSIEREVNSLPLITLLHSFSCTSGAILGPQVKSIFQEVIHQISQVLINQELLKTDLLKCYVEILITHLSHEWDTALETSARSRNTELVESFMSLVETNFRTERRVSKYASWLSVTPNHLNEVIKKMTSFSAGNLIRRRVGLEAKRKALHTRMCMKEVAYSLGFADPAHFSKFFKNTTGLNFSDFRRENISFSLNTMML